MRWLTLAVAAVAAVVAAFFVVRDDDGSEVTPDSLASLSLAGAVKDVARVGSAPGAVASDGTNVWVADTGERTISRVSMSTREVKTVRLDTVPDDLVVTALGVWVAVRAGLRRIDVMSAQPDERVDVSPRVSATRASVEYEFASLWYARGDRLLRIDPVSGATQAEVELEDDATDVTTGDGSVWVRDAGRVLYRIDPETNAVVARVRLAAGGDGRLVSAFGSIWTTLAAANALQRVGFVDNAAAATIAVGEGPIGIAASPEAVWVTNAGDGTLSKIDPYTNEVAATFDVGNAPTALVVAADRLWVAVQKR